MKPIYCLLLLLASAKWATAQNFFLGADLSYVNEMEDCGVEYFDSIQAEPYALFAKHGCNMARIRLWHTPAWYDTLNQGNRYSDLADVKRSIARAKKAKMSVLLDFHLSDFWADPKHQEVPAAWLPVVKNTEILGDSVYQYVYASLMHLHANALLPEMVQIGNETNKEILLAPDDNHEWRMDWARNAALFNRGFQAVRAVEKETGKSIQIVLHAAGPENAEWLLDGMVKNGIKDFDIIGMSYYWAWHQPTSIEETGKVIRLLSAFFPDKKVMIVETGYIWTDQWNDKASNIISATHPDYHPATPENQRDWLIALTETVIESGGIGVLYWEPAWVSSPCFTPWGQGSHQEHATFFDFENQLIPNGGIQWMEEKFVLTRKLEKVKNSSLQILTNSFSGDITLRQHRVKPKTVYFEIRNAANEIVQEGKFDSHERVFKMIGLPYGLYEIKLKSKKAELHKTYKFSPE